jgi:hypothetical protein
VDYRPKRAKTGRYLSAQGREIMKRLPILVVLLTLAASPAAAERLLVDALLTSTDPGENAENETFVICDYGTGGQNPFEPPCGSTGVAILTFTHQFFQPFQFTIDVPSSRDNILVWGLSGFSGDPDDGFGADDGGTFVFNIASPPPPPGTPAMDPDQKKRFAHWSNYVGILGGATAFAGTIFLAVGNVAAATALGASSALLWVLSSALNDIAVDPIDNNYTVIATPTPYPLPDLSGGGPCAVNIGNGLANTVGLAQAVTTSYNRMQGAVAAGDDYWTMQQAQAMVAYANQLDNELAAIDPAQLFGCTPQRPLTSAAATLAFEQNLSTNGMPAFMTAAYNAAGITDALWQANGFLYVQDPELVAEAYNALFGPKDSRAVYWQALANNVP